MSFRFASDVIRSPPYQAEMRLRRALALLLETDRSMTQIALDLGFANHGHFCNAFRRRFRTTPGSARRLGAGYRCFWQA